MDNCSHPVSLLSPLQKAIQSHPSLEILRFSDWRDINNDLEPSFLPSVRRRPLVVEDVLLTSNSFKPHLLSNQTFLARLSPYLRHFQIQLHTLQVQTLNFDASVYRLLVGVDLPGLRTLKLSIYGTSEVPFLNTDIFHTGSWMQDVLSSFPFLSDLSLFVTGWEPYFPYRLPLKALARIPGLEGFGHSTLSTRFSLAHPNSVVLSFDPANSQGRRELNGLKISDESRT